MRRVVSSRRRRRGTPVDRRGFGYPTTRARRLTRAHNSLMPRVFLSHSSRDSRSAMAVKAWLIEREPGRPEEIFLDLDPHTGIRPGERWKQALQQANARCEAVICLLSA